MPDDLPCHEPHDCGRIDLDEPQDVRYWTRTLGVTPHQLCEAVCAVGDATEAVRNYLRSAHVREPELTH